jgi:hypothetical protein
MRRHAPNPVTRGSICKSNEHDPPLKNIPEWLSCLVNLGQEVVRLRHDASSRSRQSLYVLSSIWQNRNVFISGMMSMTLVALAANDGNFIK